MIVISSDPQLQRRLAGVYWATRIGMAFIWLWTAYASWFLFPHDISLEWLHRLGIGALAHPLFVAATVADLMMGLVSCLRPSRRVWQLQFCLVAGYSAVLAVFLPEFWAHPFGPLIKNVAVLSGLAYLVTVEGRGTSPDCVTTVHR